MCYNEITIKRRIKFMKKNLLFLTLSLIIALLMCVSAFALTLDSA